MDILYLRWLRYFVIIELWLIKIWYINVFGFFGIFVFVNKVFYDIFSVCF